MKQYDKFVELNTNELMTVSGGWITAACAVIALWIQARDYAYKQGYRDGKASKKKKK